MTQRCDLARGAIGGFLNQVARMTSLPYPLDLMPVYGAVQTLPPFVICLAPKTATHRLDHITRVGIKAHDTRFGQGFEAERGGRNLSLLVGRVAQISSEGPPQSTKPEQRHCRGARFFAAIAEARSIAIDGDRFHGPAIRISFSHT